MKKLTHKSAQAAHYNQEAASYDLFNEKNSIIINKTIETILKINKVHSVLDLTCGTGSQVFWLNKKGYNACGFDINTNMIKIAKNKAKEQKVNLNFATGDIRTTQAGKFDAVVTIFNAIGHLTKTDFKKAIRNIYKNLNGGGIYIFDIFNLDYLLDKDNITRLTIDWLKRDKNKIIREIQYSTIDTDGILASFDHYYEKIGTKKAKTSNSAQTLQVYSADELNEMLTKLGFKVIKQCNVDGSRFSKNKSERILTVAKKISTNKTPKLKRNNQMSAQLLNKKIKNFTLAATDEQNISLNQLKGKNVVLYFYPRDNTPGCTTESNDFKDQYHAFAKANTIILGVSRDSIKSHENFKAKFDFPFELLSDENEELCQYFDVIKEKNMYGKKVMGIERSTFLIDKAGILQAEWRKVKVPGHVDAVLAKVLELENS